MTGPYYADDKVTLWHGDCRTVLAGLTSASVDAIVTDPPYELTFMGKGWDGTGVAYDPETWEACLRVLKPGGHLLAFGGSRTWHRMVCAAEDAGFQIRDSIAWHHGSGFPKSLDLSKAIDKAAGVEREVVGVAKGAATLSVASLGKFSPEYAATPDAATPDAATWQGWGTALKPAFEPIVVARKPLADGTVAANVLAHGTGALNIDGCRVATSDTLTGSGTPPLRYGGANSRPFHEGAEPRGVHQHDAGRWPPNMVLTHAYDCGPDGGSPCAEGCPVSELNAQSGVSRSTVGSPRSGAHGNGWGLTTTGAEYADEGGASRFFPTFRYEAKAPTSERPRAGDIAHPTVKPLALMQWLVRLVTPRRGLVLDPFAGSGTTGEAAILEGMRAVLIEREADYLPLITQRAMKTTDPIAHLTSRGDDLGLFEMLGGGAS